MCKKLFLSGGFGLLEVMIASILMLSALAACFTLVKVQNITIGDPDQMMAAYQTQTKAGALHTMAVLSTRDDPGDVWDLNTAQPTTDTTVGNTTFHTTHTVTQAPGGRDYRIATVTTTWTQRDI